MANDLKFFWKSHMNISSKRTAALEMRALTGMRRSNYEPPMMRLLWWWGGGRAAATLRQLWA